VVGIEPLFVQFSSHPRMGWRYEICEVWSKDDLLGF